MAEQAQDIPHHSAALTNERGQPTDDWYAVFLLWRDFFNRISGNLETTGDDLSTRPIRQQEGAEAVTIQYAINGDYRFLWPQDGATGVEVDVIAASGTATVAFAKNGVAFGGPNSSAGATLDTQSHPAVTLNAQDVITMTVSAAASCQMLSILFRYTYNLAGS